MDQGELDDSLDAVSTPLPEEPTNHQSYADTLRPDQEQLVFRVIGGNDAGMVIELKDEVYVLGRGRGSDIRLDGEGVSRIHARVIRKGDSVMVEDLASRNGTWLESERVLGREEVLDGQRITIGDVVLRLSRLDQVELASARELAEAARRDPLTHCFNRGHFDRRLSAEVARTHKNERPTSLIMIDLDYFKKVNDRFGHSAGDAVLRSVGKVLSVVTRLEDVVARYGGEEFAIVVPGGTVLGVALLAQRVRTAIERMVIDADGRQLRITASLGVATLECGEAASAHELTRAADAALYGAKHEGRNRVQVGKLGMDSDDVPSEAGLTVTVSNER